MHSTLGQLVVCSSYHDANGVKLVRAGYYVPLYLCKPSAKPSCHLPNRAPHSPANLSNHDSSSLSSFSTSARPTSKPLRFASSCPSSPITRLLTDTSTFPVSTVHPPPAEIQDQVLFYRLHHLLSIHYPFNSAQIGSLVSSSSLSRLN